MEPDDLDGVDEIDLDEEDEPTDEEKELEELGMAPDGSRMQIGDISWNGRPWDPDGKHLR